MKVRFNLDSGENIDSNNQTDWLDTVEDLGLEEGEWEKLNDDKRYEMQVEWFNGDGYPEYSYDEEEI
tara:strand:+ start:165 stop:365 length:201 start_codon:yes stop_codon:yes gene_type:complete